MKKLMQWLTQRNVLIFIGLCLVGVLIWLVGPRWPIFESPDGGYVRPLAGVWPRLITILGVFAIWGVVLLVRLVRTTLAAAKLRDEVAGEPTQSEIQIGQLEDAFSQAAAALERRKGSKGKRSLAELPWYMVLGPSGVGKTELLRSSGLDFPYEDKSSQKYVDGAGGTLNCKWWLGRDAILLDTAGRYVQQDQHGEADRAEWERFLSLLRRHRRRQPLNGLIAVISADDVLQIYDGSEQSMRAEADRLRSRIFELRDAFNMSLPVYLIVSKTDLIAGFSEFFRDLNSDDLRAQIWGFDLPDRGDSVEELRAGLDSGFSRLDARLRMRALHRMADEKSLRHNTAVQSFPWRIANLEDPLRQFIELAFGPDTRGEDAWLRGVYLTSATQVGSPIDQLTTELSQMFGLAEIEQSQVGGDGMSYFVRDLFLDKVYPEQHLAGESAWMSTARHWSLRVAAVAAVAAIVVSTLVWVVGFRDSTAALTTASDQLDQVAATIPKGDDREDPGTILDYLSTLKELSNTSKARSDEVGMIRHFGLSAVPRMSRHAEELYADGLYNYFIPYLAALLYDELLLRRSTAVGEAATPWQDTFDEFLLLEYLQAFNISERLNEPARKFEILEWFDGFFEQEFSANGELLEQLQSHVAFYRNRPLPTVNFTADAVVESQQSFLDRDKTLLTYELMRGAYQGAIARDIRLSSSPNETMFSIVFDWPEAGSGQPLEIPGVFTRAGLELLLDNEGIEGFINEQRQREWVLGEEYSLPSKSAMRTEMERLYVRDYIMIWQQALKSLRIKSIRDETQGRMVLEAVVAPRSPIRELLKKVYEQTRLHLETDSRGGGAATSAAGRLVNKTKIGRTARRLGLGSGSEQQEPPRKVITEAFAELNALSDGTSGLTELDSVLREVANLLSAFRDPNRLPEVVGKIDSICTMQPEPVRQWLCSLGATSSDAIDLQLAAHDRAERASVRRAAEADVINIYRADVLQSCFDAIHGRYPADPLSQTDISLDDFRRIFGADGVLDRFTNDALGPYLDRTRRPWQWRSDEGTDPLQLGPALPSTLQQATEIRRAFELPLTLSLRAGEVDPRIAKVLLRVDGKAFEYLQGPRETIDIPWPGKESSGVHLVLQIAGGGEQRRRWDGQWALFRALSDATLEKGTARGQLHVTFDVGGYRVPILINTNRTIHPLLDNPLEGFRCPPL